MNKVTKPIIILCCASVVFAIQNNNKATEGPQQAIEKAILKVHEEMKAAAENLNIQGLYEHVLDTNDVIIEDGNLRLTRKEAFDLTSQGMQRIKELSYSYSHKNITVISPTTVLWTGTGSAAVNSNWCISS